MRRMRLRGIVFIGTVASFTFCGLSFHLIEKNFRPDLAELATNQTQMSSVAPETVVVSNTTPQNYVSSYEFNVEVHRVKVHELKVCGTPKLGYTGENIDIKETLYMDSEVEVLTELTFRDSDYQKWSYVKTKSGTSGWVLNDGLS